MDNVIDSNITVLTLDAGGTNFIFSAIQGNSELVEPLRYPANADNLRTCLSTIIKGFEKVLTKLASKADAISFAFPGPADYTQGIIGDLPNFPSFKGGVALGPMLMEKFEIPVFINNDGDLFAYGEALFGLMPEINKKLTNSRSQKKHKNLVGITLGTGIGCGIVINNNMLQGDNSCGAEIHNTLNAFNPTWNAEEGISTRAIQRVYSENNTDTQDESLMPKDIYNIAMGKNQGNKIAAKEAFRQYGANLGSTIANIVTLIDGLIVLGGGITAAWKLFYPAMFEALNKPFVNHRGEPHKRLYPKIFNLQDPHTFNDYANGCKSEIKIPFSDKSISYDSMPRTGIGISHLGASKAIALGAYAYASKRLIND